MEEETASKTEHASVVLSIVVPPAKSLLSVIATLSAPPVTVHPTPLPSAQATSLQFLELAPLAQKALTLINFVELVTVLIFSAALKKHSMFVILLLEM